VILFDSHYQPSHRAEEHCVVLPIRIESKTALFAFLKEALRLPDYFGHNWDALEECLNDPDALGHHKAVQVHHDLPLENETSEQRTYLQILGAAARESPRLDAVFPDAYRVLVMKALSLP
jgi:RNAse (barnase) inhibitor barstar